ncbi:putative F-box protein [Hibiscus syriacus]|uniref:F-box protein n=1 Tax=Hibiscus syriacus TaxID=106335 RepID=A0A6A2Z346_HIBSY|nr:probable F-box protein At4g22030 [Hibiscus syriacus]KAE8686381.1 putative F-box protein [Hibiscus syriacus]
MAGLEVSSSRLFSKRNFPSLCYRRGIVGSTLTAPRVHLGPVCLPKLSSRDLAEEFEKRTGYPIARQTTKSSDRQVIAKLYAIMEAVADRVEMHNNIGYQRDNWNRLLSTSINTMTLTGATMAGLAATVAAEGAPFTALKLSSVVLYVAATGLLLVMNKIQPSQLAEEQRNASRLFKQLYFQIQTTLSVGKPDTSDVNEAMEKVLALDKACPLSLMGSMLEKFPSEVEPARWWPKQRQKQVSLGENNGWNRKLEKEMKQIVSALKKKDSAEYIDLCNKTLKLNKMLATSGPLLTLLAALGSSCVGTTHCSWPVTIGVMAGAMAAVVNTVEHGSQVGMVVEMYRNNAGFFKLIEENIMSNMSEKDVGRRENGEILEMKVALQLGRSLSELEQLAAIAESSEESASKLF